MNKKSTYFLLVGLVIVLFIAGYFVLHKTKVFTPSSSQTAENTSTSWLTYKNEQYGYEIQYPKGVEILLTNNGVNVVNIGIESFLKIPKEEIRKNNLNDDLSLLSFRILAEDNAKHLSLEEWVHDVELKTQRGMPYPDEIKQITINNEPAYYLAYTGQGNSFGVGEYTPVFIYLAHNNYLYRISGIKIPDEPSQNLSNDSYFPYVKQYVPIFEKMVESFKFVD